MKKKLLFIINTMGRAGAETALTELLNRLDAMGDFDLSLYAMIPCGEMFHRVPDRVRILNKHRYNGSLLSFPGRIQIAKSILSSFFYRMTGFRMTGYLLHNIKEQRASGNRIQYDKLLWRLLANGQPAMKETYDLAVSFIEGASAYFLADKVSARHKAAFIHIDYNRAGYTPFMDRNCFSGMEKIFVVSDEVGEKFCSVYPEYRNKIQLFRNLLDIEGIRARSRDEGFLDSFQGIRLVTVGRLHPQKGYDIAIEALSRLKRDGYPVRWYILGEGMERKRLEMLIKKYGVEDSFLLLGAKDNPYPYIKQADLYVHATRYEGKSIAIEEAQILGKAIVASDCTGNREQIIPGYDGTLLTLNTENLARELERLIDDQVLRQTYETHVLEKRFEFPEDLDGMLAILKDEEV